MRGVTQYVFIAYIVTVLGAPFLSVVNEQLPIIVALVASISACLLVLSSRFTANIVSSAKNTSSIGALAGLYMLACAISYYFAGNFGAMWWGVQFEFGTVGAQILFCSALFIALLTTEQERKIAVSLLTLLACACSIYLLTGMFFGVLPQIGSLWPVLSCVLAVSASFALARACDKAVPYRYGYVFALIVICASIVVLPEKAAILSLFISSTVLIVMNLWRRERTPLLLSCGIALFALVVLLLGPHSPILDTEPDIRPSAHVTNATITPLLFSSVSSLLFGAGPNSFGSTWDQFHPAAFNMTPVWDQYFTEGFSSLFTLLATYGICGTLAFGLIVVACLRPLTVRGTPDSVTYTAATVALLVSFSFYTLGTELFILLAFLLGSTAATLTGTSYTSADIQTRGNSIMRIGLFTTALIIGSLLCYVAVSQYTAKLNSARAQNYREDGNDVNELAATYYARVISVWAAPVYMRERARDLFEESLRLRGISASDVAIRETYEDTVVEAIQTINSAVENNLQDYESWLLRARIFISFNVPDYAIEATVSLDQMEKMAPVRPETYYLKAVLAERLGDKALAFQYIDRALYFKPDYQEAMRFAESMGYSRGSS